MRSAMIVDGRTLFVEAIPDGDRFRVLTPGHVEIGTIDCLVIQHPGDAENVLRHMLHEHDEHSTYRSHEFHFTDSVPARSNGHTP